jgi:hypothetical protein
MEDGGGGKIKVIGTRVAYPWIPVERADELEDYDEEEEVQPVKFKTVEEADELVKKFRKSNNTMASTNDNCPGDIVLSRSFNSGEQEAYSLCVARKQS